MVWRRFSGCYTMAGSVNMPGALALGDLKSTTSVSLGLGGALVIDNSGTGPVGSVALAGPLVSTSSLDIGSNSLTCGAISCGALSSSSATVRSGGVLRADTGGAAAPALCFGTDSATGVYRAAAATTGFASAGTESMRVGGTVSIFVPLTTNSNTLACGAMTSGAISCASVASTGDVTQPRYSARLYRNATQSISNNTVTAVALDTIETSGSGGGTSNWTSITLPATLFTIPKAGTYAVFAEVSFVQNAAGGYRSSWFEVNNGGTPGTQRRWGETLAPPCASASTNNVSCFEYVFALNDTVQLCCAQDSGGSININGSANRYSYIQIVRLSE
jgi:hypothetical protein